MPIKKARVMKYNRIARAFRRWLRSHPNASLDRQISTFDAFADAELTDAQPDPEIYQKLSTLS